MIAAGVTADQLTVEVEWVVAGRPGTSESGGQIDQVGIAGRDLRRGCGRRRRRGPSSTSQSQLRTVPVLGRRSGVGRWERGSRRCLGEQPEPGEWDGRCVEPAGTTAPALRVPDRRREQPRRRRNPAANHPLRTAASTSPSIAITSESARASNWPRKFRSSRAGCPAAEWSIRQRTKECVSSRTLECTAIGGDPS